MDRQKLEELAQLAAECGVRDVSFSVSTAAYDALRHLDGAVCDASVYASLGASDGPAAIDAVQVTLHGVHFTAQCPSRPATADEREHLERVGRRHESTSCRYPGVG